MARYKHLRVRVSAFMLLTLGLVMAPGSVMAGSEGPQNGPSDRECSTIHKIALGENLTWIAEEHGLTVEALAEANGIEDANLIVENQALCIPHAEKGQNGDHTKDSRGSQGDWKSYGVPGHSYDPGLMKGQENGNGPSNGDAEEENGYAREEKGTEENGKSGSENGYGVPGKADEPKRDEGYWKDEKQYPRPQTNDVDPSDGEEERPVGNPEGPRE